MSHVKFCNRINAESHDSDDFKQMKKSVRDITKKTANYMIDWYKRNYKDWGKDGLKN